MTGRRWAIVALAGCLVTMAPLIAVPLIVAVLVAGGAAADGPTACANNTGTVAQVDGAGAGASLADLDAKQRSVAGTIILVGRQRGIDVNGIIAALIAGYQESTYLVYANDGTGGDLAPEQMGIERSLALPHDAVGTDHGSLGVFQQQWPWWGTMSELMDPQTSAEKFYAALVGKVPNYPELDPGDVAQTVQVSAYPDAYHQWEPLARQLLTHASELGGEITSPSGPASGPASATAVSGLCGPGAAMDCPPTGLAAERGLTPDALRVLRCVDEGFGRHTYLGVGERANNPTSDHPTGRAVDIMIDRWRTRLGNVEGWRIARWVADNAAGLGMTYVIFDGRIWSTERADEGWRRYQHPSGAVDPTAAHRDHVHVSVAGDSAGQPGLGGRWQPPMRPGSSTVTATFGACSDLWSSCHTGIDLAAPSGTTIYAAHAGRVTTVGYDGDGDGYGNYTVISVENIDLYYAHQTSIQVDVGEVVAAGQPIGTVGATGNTTGPHLHYEIRVDDQAVDPEPFMIARGIDLRELA